MIELTKSIY